MTYFVSTETQTLHVTQSINQPHENATEKQIKISIGFSVMGKVTQVCNF